MTYATMDGRVLDLSALTDEERAYFDECYRAYRVGEPWSAFTQRVETTQNPLLRPTQGVITRQVWDHRLFQAVRDLEDRIGCQQGELGMEPGDAEALRRDPLDDEWIHPEEAARRKDVTVQAVHRAIKRGDLVARGRYPREISARSLEAWQPSRIHQRAGRAQKDSALVVRKD